MKIVLTHSEHMTDGVRLEILTDDDVLIDVRESKVQSMEGNLTAWARMLEGVQDEDIISAL